MGMVIGLKIQVGALAIELKWELQNKWQFTKWNSKWYLG